MKPTSTLHRAFDFIVAKAFFPAGVVTSIDPMVDNVFQVGSNFDYIWLYTKGSVSVTETTTGEVQTRSKNDCTLNSPYPRGEWRTEFLEDTEILCLGPYTNATKLPLAGRVTPFVFLVGQQIEVAQGTQLFIGVGSVQMDAKTFNSPAQLRFTSGAKTLTAVEDTYGFIVL